MFGYINVNGKELTEENRAVYQSFYCGLCRTLHSLAGVRGQMLVNYDVTFLVVLLSGLYEPQTKGREFTCAVHPLKKRHCLTNEVQEYAARMNILLAYHNMMDDWRDENKRVKKSMASLLNKDYERIRALYPRQAAALEKGMEKLAEYERQNESNIDLTAGVNGEILGEIFAWKEDEWYDELKVLGFYMGKFIYLMDAYEDYVEDIRKNRYNPLRFIQTGSEQEFETLCRLMMTSMMSECAKSFERLPILMYADILRNILYSGVWSRYEYLQLKKKGKNKNHDRSISGARSQQGRL